MKQAREELGKSQEDFGAMLGCSGVHISQIERGRRMPSNEMLLKITRSLECNQREVRDLLLLRVRASCDVSPEDFEKMYGDIDDMIAMADSEIHRFVALMQKAESKLSLNQFRLLKN